MTAQAMKKEDAVPKTTATSKDKAMMENVDKTKVNIAATSATVVGTDKGALLV